MVVCGVANITFTAVGPHSQIQAGYIITGLVISSIPFKDIQLDFVDAVCVVTDDPC